MTEKSLIEQRFRDIEANYREITENINAAALQSGRKPDSVRFMAVTKTVEPVYINHALSLGVDLIGENKVQELLAKLPYLRPPTVCRHLIGHLQTNKVRKIIEEVSCIQSVDGVSLAKEISKQAVAHGKTMDVLLEVNIGEEVSKTGFSPAELLDSGAEIAELENVRIRGLMAIPPVCENEKKARTYFSEARALYESLEQTLKGVCEVDTFSVGMSSDYVPAILEGATMVRIGSALFGPRRY